MAAPKESNSASFTLNDYGEDFSLTISGPFGVGSTTITQMQNQITLRHQGQEYLYSSLYELDQSLTFKIPFQHLRYWLLGSPSPLAQHPSVVYQDEQIIGFQQAEWQLHFSKFEQVDTMRLPKKIIATSGDTRIKLIIKQWQPQTLWRF